MMFKMDNISSVVLLLLIPITLTHQALQEIKLCNKMPFNVTSKVQCFCRSEYESELEVERNADCWVADSRITPDDFEWERFDNFNEIEKIKISIKGEGRLRFVPTNAIKRMKKLKNLTIKFGSINAIESFAFANLTSLTELTLKGNEIRTLKWNAFSNHPNLALISLDRNKITEIKRNVFHRIHTLEKLYLNSNNITTLHDQAFEHLKSLTDLDLESNSIFVVTKETFIGLKNLMRLELSSNNLEVIGDYTFSQLHNLRELILEKNKIEVIDENAFEGLSHLVTLSLAENKLKNIESNHIFAPLKAIAYLNIRGNLLETLTETVFAPIYTNFLTEKNKFEFTENRFKCDCRLAWFESLKNQTKNNFLSENIDSMLCYPSKELLLEYKEFSEKQKTEETTEKAAADDFNDYYTEEEMHGQLFLFDIPKSLLICPGNSKTSIKIESTSHMSSEITTPDIAVKQNGRHSNFAPKTTPIDLHPSTKEFEDPQTDDPLESKIFEEFKNEQDDDIFADTANEFVRFTSAQVSEDEISHSKPARITKNLPPLPTTRVNLDSAPSKSSKNTPLLVLMLVFSMITLLGYR